MGDLHNQSGVRRTVGGFTVTDGWYPPSLRIARHDHEPASLCVVLAGGYEEAYGRRSREVGPGSIIVHPAGEEHDQRHGSQAVRVLTIEVDPEHLNNLRPAVRVFDEAWDLRGDALAANAARIRRENCYEDPASHFALESEILDLVAAVSRSRAPDVGRARWLTKVRDRLDEHAVGGVSAKDLAELAGVHPVHLARAFRGAFGQSLGDYSRNVQVGRALLLLEDGDLPLAAIAQDAGFADQSHMTRLIRDRTGLTPGAWRRLKDTAKKRNVSGVQDRRS